MDSLEENLSYALMGRLNLMLYPYITLMLLMLSAIAQNSLHFIGLPSITAYRAHQLRVFECRLQDVEH